MSAARSTRYISIPNRSTSPRRKPRDGSKLNAFVELRAPNYPDSTYTLTDDPQRDQLKGFDVKFVRMK